MLGLSSQAQTVYIDALTAPAMILYSDEIDKGLDNTKTELSGIKKAQALVFTQLTYANNLHDKVLAGLTEVSGTVSNALTIKYIYEDTKAIVEDVKEAVQIAAGNPVLTIFAVEHSKHFQVRAVELSAEITRIITGGEHNMMNAGERQSLLNYIHTEVKLLRASAYLVKDSMYWAKMFGIWNSLNPFKQWVNQDVTIMRGIINQAKML